MAGSGPLPGRVVEAARARGRDVFVLALTGITDPAPIAAVPHAWVRLGAVGDSLRRLAEEGVDEVVLAGAVRRPSFGQLGLDARGIRMLASLADPGLGDDRVLARVVAELEAEGFHVVGIDDVLDDVRATLGPVGRLAPGHDHVADITLGVRVARALGALDVGQAVIVQRGRVLGVEAAEGTDDLVRRCASLRGAEPGGVLVKVAKPGQERRADLPAIGPTTVAVVGEAGFAGIAVEADRALILDRAAVRAAADARGLFVVGVRAEPP